jgi:CBS domain-containing protein
MVLRQMAELLQANCRTSDYLCRYGGEELSVLLPGANEEVAVGWAERARHSIESATLAVGDRVVRATASFGVSVRTSGNDTMEQLVDRADQALIVAKKLGRNRVMRAAAMYDSGAVLEKVRQHGELFQGVAARDAMTSPVASLNIGATVGEAAAFLRRLHINSAPVVDEQGKLVGVLSEKDVISTLPSQDAWTAPIERIMQRTFVSFEEDAPLDEICEFLSRVSVRRVFIVRDGVPIGVVSQGGLLRWYGNRVAPREVAEVQASPADKAVRERLLEGARAVSECAAHLARNATHKPDDPLAAVVEGVRKLQNAIDAQLASAGGQKLPISLTDSDSFPLSAIALKPPAPTG